jgi:tetratricopeptide (TPR) repeat protein
MTLRIRSLHALAALLILAACTVAPSPAALPQSVQRTHLLVDPRIGYEAPPAPASERRLLTAWNLVAQGDLATAERRLNALVSRDPAYRPAQLALAGLALEAGNHALAERLIDAAAEGTSGWFAADVYRAELARARGDLREAWSLYEPLSRSPGAPAGFDAAVASVAKAYFEQLFEQARSAPTDQEAIARLREAIAVVPNAVSARVLLAEKLLAGGSVDDARRAIDPLLIGGEGDRREVQSVLAEIDVARGRYQEAITRLERLAGADPRYMNRLDQVKRKWHEANLPPRYHAAVASPELTREELATLLFWKVSAARFAHNVPEPPIAIDIDSALGRDELVRAMALGFLRVDPVTRRVLPEAPATRQQFLRAAARALTLRGVPPCAAAAAGQPNESVRAEMMLTGCGVDVAPLLRGEGSLSGPVASRIAEQIDNIVSRSGE